MYVYSVHIHVHVHVIEYRFIAMRHIFNSLLLEHKHSKQNDDIQYVSARKPSSAVHTQFTTANSKDEVECLVCFIVFIFIVLSVLFLFFF